MKRGYVRVSKVGPTLDEQIAELTRAGVDCSGDGASVYIDPLPKGDQPALVNRDRAVSELTDGDELVVACPSRLGTTASDVLSVLGAVAGRAATVRLADSGELVEWHPDAVKALAFAHIAEMENRREVAAAARAAQAASGRVGGAPKKMRGAVLEEAKRLWADPSLSAAEVSDRVGVPVRTLYRNLGQRGAQ